tara:strand:- start:266 stop:790 length:525 start_codon:yes stop_codon:yes gene_type:complete
MVTMDLKSEGNVVLAIGKTEGHLEQSIFAKSILNEKNGPPPEINLFNEKNNGSTIMKLMKNKLVLSCKDVSLGGILVALSKMCIKGKKGIKLNKLKSLINKFEFYFSEDQGRYIIEVSKKNSKKVENILKENSVHFDNIGEIQKDNYINMDDEKISIDELAKHNKNWLKEYMIQ